MQTIKKGADFTGYLIGKCTHHEKAIGTRWYVGPYYFNGIAADGKNPLNLKEKIYCSGGCGRIFRLDGGRPIYGRYVEEVICNAKCTGAVGPSCDCSCGGKNHGGH